jgi:hypothetical protein
MSQSDSPTLDELPTATREAIEALGDLGQGLERIKELDDEEFHELVALMETLGMDEEAESLRSTRRDLLKTAGAGAAGVAAGAAGVIGATDPARADPNNTEDGTIGDGTEDWNVQDIDGNHADLDSVTTESQNNVQVVGAGEDLQAAVDDVSTGTESTPDAGMVRLRPNSPDDVVQHDPDDWSLPVVADNGVTIDARGAYIEPSSDASALFDLRRNVTFLGHGTHIFEGSFTGSVWRFRADNETIGNREAPQILGYPRVQGTEPLIFEFVQTTGGSIASVLATAHGYNGGRGVLFNSTGSGGFLSNNEVRLKGAFATDDAVVEITGSELAEFNRVVGEAAKIKPSNGTVVRFDNPGKKNRVTGNFIDPEKAATTVEWTSDAGPNNKVLANGFSGLEFVDNSDHPTNNYNESFFSFYLRDDWEDGEFDRQVGSLQSGTYLSDAEGAIKTARYPCQWRIESGSPTVTAGELALPDGSSTVQRVATRNPPDMTVGEWEFTVQAQSSPSSGRFRYRLFDAETTTNIWQVVMNGSGEADLEKVDGGTFSDVINGTWPADTSRHVVSVTRDVGGDWELFVDGTRQGTVTDSFLPSGALRTEFVSTLDAEMRMDYLVQK